jgi:4-methyl-5(b-hydroxyethyl)-thiazole monophosphate biosynthesis
MNILLFCAKGFETMEFAPFIDIMGWAADDLRVSITVTTAGFTRTVISTFGVEVTVNKQIDEIDVADYDALAIPGGFEEYGFYEEVYDERFLQLVREFDRLGKPIASICVAALPVAKSGALLGRCATTYHLGNGKRQKQLAELGAMVKNEPIVIDHNIITSYCPETAPGVAFALLEMLTSLEDANRIRRIMGFPEKN